MKGTIERRVSEKGLGRGDRARGARVRGEAEEKVGARGKPVGKGGRQRRSHLYGKEGEVAGRGKRKPKAQQKENRC